jgi:leader peptidase (prepilin peptidase)/N-methyltransferase
MGKYEPVREDALQLDIPLSPLSPKRSFCPHCMQKLKWFHMVPLLSWFALKGRCAFCRASIPFRYCSIEFATAIFAVMCYLRFGQTPAALVVFIVVCALIVITYIDIDYMIIPDVITYPGTALGLIIGAATSYLPRNQIVPLGEPFVSSLSDSLWGIFFGAGTLLLIWWVYLVVRKREGLGLGDVKLLAFLGALFGYECSIITLFIGSVLGSVIGLSLIVLGKHKFANYLSFGPYLVAAGIIYIFNFANLFVYLTNPAQETIWRALQ